MPVCNCKRIKLVLNSDGKLSRNTVVLSQQTEVQFFFPITLVIYFTLSIFEMLRAKIKRTENDAGLRIISIPRVHDKTTKIKQVKYSCFVKLQTEFV